MDDNSTQIENEVGEKKDRFICKACWGYKPDSFISCFEDTPSYSFVVTDSSDIGLELVRIKGVIKASEEEKNNPDFLTAFPPILRRATPEDMKAFNANHALERQMAEFSQKQSDETNMGMRVVEVRVSLDCKKAMVIYTSPDKVDYRNFLLLFKNQFHIHPIMRQIGNKDRAKLIGGIGVCGLPLCCKTFLSHFNGTPISMIKNQIEKPNFNVQKLSGQCGSLMCCLGYENDYYKEFRPLYPNSGDTAEIEDVTWTVKSVNIIADTITVTDGDTYRTYSRAQWDKISKGEEIDDEEEEKAQANIVDTIKKNKLEGLTFVPKINQKEELKYKNSLEDYEDYDEDDPPDFNVEKLDTKEEAEEDEKDVIENMEEINDMNKNGNKNNNHFNNKNGHNNSQQHNSKGGRGFSKPGPFGFKPRPQSNKEQAAANPFGFASHNDDEVKKDNSSYKSNNHNEERRFDPTKLTLPSEESIEKDKKDAKN